MKIKIELTENTIEAKEQLTSGYGYIVVYFDVALGERRMTIGRWNGECFKYPPGRFISKDDTPVMDTKGVLRRNRIVGWYQVISWRDNG